MKLVAAFCGVIPVFCGLTVLTGAWAANSYNMNYNASDAQPLGTNNNAKIDASLVDGLTPLIIHNDNISVEFSNSNEWNTNYMLLYRNADDPSRQICTKVKYIVAPTEGSDSIDLGNGVYYNVSNQSYTTKISLNKIVFDGNAVTGNYAIGIAMDNSASGVGTPKGSILTGFRVFSDSECQNRINDIVGLNRATNNGGKIFVQTNQKLYNKGTSTIFTSNKLYYGIIDVDQAQSFKILNSGNELSPDNMYIKSASSVQPDSATTSLKNMYTASGKYIYSQYTLNSDESLVNITSGSDVFVKINEGILSDGLNLVYGFVGPAGSTIGYYAQQYQVEYESDSYGTISGITEEDVISGDHPSGSTSTPNEHYAFDHWIADKNITLTNGTTITAGQPMTPNQVRQVVVSEDLVFTAIHNAVPYQVEYESDSHGTISGITEEDVSFGDHPSGSTSTPNEHYKLDHWVADKNVTLTNGTTITIGRPITPNQVRQVVVSEDLVFTAIHSVIQYQVEYESDEHGTITGITEEDVPSGDNPSGSTSTPEERYKLDYWVADKDVTLTDGTMIPTGQPITSDQIKQVVVGDDLVFTAVHKVKPVIVPDTGAFTSDEQSTVAIIPISVVGVLAGAFAIIFLRKLGHKKIGFEEK